MDYEREFELLKGQQAEILQMLKPIFSSKGKKIRNDRTISVARVQRMIIEKHNRRFDERK
jgi:hypothetical protein